MCIAALYINTAVSFKSNVTKIYHCWPSSYIFVPIIPRDHLYFGYLQNMAYS